MEIIEKIESSLEELKLIILDPHNVGLLGPFWTTTKYGRKRKYYTNYNNVKHGMSLLFSLDGKLFRKEKYYNGCLNGKQIRYNSFGNIHSEEYYEHGQLIRTVYMNINIHTNT